MLSVDKLLSMQNRVGVAENGPGDFVPPMTRRRRRRG